MRLISSRDNPLVKRLAALSQSGRERRKLGLTVLDGDHLVLAALDAGLALDALVFSERGAGGEAAHRLLQRAAGACDLVQMPDAVFAACSPVDTPSGVLAVLRTPVESPLAPPADQSIVVLDGVQDAGNLGTILRTAAAAGLRQVFLTPGCAQAWSPRVLRAGMGAHFVLSICEQTDALAVLDSYAGTPIAMALGAGCRSLYELPLTRPLAWLFGAEGQGLSEGLLSRAELRAQIPMVEGIESLNVAAAAAICLFEQRRQWLALQSPP